MIHTGSNNIFSCLINHKDIIAINQNLRHHWPRKAQQLWFAIHIMLCGNGMDLPSFIVDIFKVAQPKENLCFCFVAHWSIEPKCALGSQSVYYKFY